MKAHFVGLILLILCSCSEKKTIQLPSENKDAKYDCLLSSQDSAVRHFLTFSFPALEKGDWKKALSYYEHAARMESSLSGIALYAGRLNETIGELDSARFYYELEIKKDLELIKSKKYACRADLIVADCKEAKVYLNRLKK